MNRNTPSLSNLVAALVGAGLVTAVQSVASPSQGMPSMPGMKSQGMKAPSAQEATGSKMLMAAQQKSMKEMMSKPTPMTGDVDRDFSAMMAEHHALGIKMAEIELEFGKSAPVRALASKIRATQMKERTMLLQLAKTAK